MKKNILIIGSGGREDALAWGISRSPEVDKVYCIPGNVGTKKYAENIRLWSLTLSIIFFILGIINSKLLTPLNILWSLVPERFLSYNRKGMYICWK